MNKPKAWPWFIVVGCVLVVLIARFLPWTGGNIPATSDATNAARRDATAGSPTARPGGTARHYATGAPAHTAEEIVARKFTQFGRNRRELIHALAKRFQVEVPPDVQRFFDTVENGRWEEIDAAHKALLLGEELNTPRSAELHPIWRPIQETWGVAREAHNWPAQKLLDYGEAVLGSLRPGMIYMGGTDPGCFIPTFLNETSEGEHQIVLTQNALADGTYLDYQNFLYGDRLNTLTQDDSQRAFADYMADAQKRLEHDQQFPEEPKQLRPGEDVRFIENRLQVSGQVAVMAINEKLLQMLMDKNPDATFAIEQSFAFKSMYPDATILGPIMELRARDEQGALTPERAAESLDYWRTTAQELANDPETPPDSDPRKAYAKLAAEQAALLLDRNYPAQAEQIFRLSTELCLTLPEATFGYVNLLKGQNRLEEALRVVESAVKAAPDNQEFRNLFESLRRAKKN